MSQINFTSFHCSRCRHVIGNDFGFRLEITDERGKTTLIVSRRIHNTARCPECLSFIDWSPHKPKKTNQSQTQLDSATQVVL